MNQRISGKLSATGVTVVVFVWLAGMLWQLKQPAPVVDTAPPAVSIPAEDPEPTQAAEPLEGFRAKVIGVSDGDTIDVLKSDNVKIRLRLNAIDAPETGQPYGKNSKTFVSNTVGGQMVRIVDYGTDRYGRLISEVYGADTDSLNVQLVRAGFAWHYTEYAPEREDLAAAQREARSQLLGLWAESHEIVAPWDWRKLSKVERDELR